MKILFWASFLVVLYVYIGYPAMVYLLSLFCKNPVKKSYIYPRVSIIISAYNEEANIENKIKSILNLDYPFEKLEILIGSDGSTDRTEDIINQFVAKEIKLYRLPLRQGKPSVLNLLKKEAKGDILVFTDARQILEKNSLKELVNNFSDKNIGSVSAELVFRPENNEASGGIGLYWEYEKFIRKCESSIGSMLGATGAMYAIRKEFFSELPKDLILDDVYIPLKTVEKGYRAIFEPRAIIYDKIAKDTKKEFSRKTRTLCGNYQIFGYLNGLFNPFKSSIAWQFFSHKFLRLIVPFFLVIIFASNIFLLDQFFYKIALFLQIMFYGFAIFGALFKSYSSRFFSVPHMFCVMNLAAVAGLYRFIFGNQNIAWEK